MTREELVQTVLEATPRSVPPRLKQVSVALGILGAAGLALGFLAGPHGAGWAALLVATCCILGVAMSGVVLSAIFQMTGAKWGRAYRRLAEGSVVLMPVAIAGMAVLLSGGGEWIPWIHADHLEGGKHLWLVRGLWDARVVAALSVAYGLALVFLYYSLRRDFCIERVAGAIKGRIATFVVRGIGDREAEAERCESRMNVLAPAVAIVYGLASTVLAFDLIMALEPEWFSTLFGAWYFAGQLFAGIALLAIASVVVRPALRLDRFLTRERQADMATLLFAFCLLTTDFFWSQYLAIWYGNLPEETGWIIERTIDRSGPWHVLAWPTLAGFFAIPFLALLVRKVKRSGGLLASVAAVVMAGLFLSRFLEIAPALIDLQPGNASASMTVTLLASLLVLAGFLGAGLWLYAWFLTQVPVMPVGDPIFQGEFTEPESRA